MRNFIFIVFFFFNFSVNALNLQEVSDRLYQAMGELHLPRPIASFNEKASIPASFSADGKQLWVNPKIKAACLRYQRDDDDVAMEEIALAALLGEVMYRQLSGEGVSSKSTANGLLLAHMAGYPATEIALSVWPRIQGSNQDTTHNQWLSDSHELVNDLSGVFNAAKYSMITSHYLEAGMCYLYVLEKGYKSREVYNNTGVALLLYFMKKSPDSSPIYPVNIESSSQLKRPPITRGALPDTVIIQKALSYFTEATKHDPNYASGYINSACALSILGELNNNKNYLAQAFKKADRGYTTALNQANIELQGKALLMKGIIRMLQGKHAEAKNLMNEAKKKAPKLTPLILQNKARAYFYQLTPDATARNKTWASYKSYAKSAQAAKRQELIAKGASMEALFAENLTRFIATSSTPAKVEKKEIVNGISIKRLRSIAKPETDREIKLNDSFMLKVKNYKVSTAFYLEKIEDKKDRLIMHVANSNYTLASDKGITIGSSIKDIFQKYGHTTEAPLGLEGAKVLSYETLGISFVVNSKFKVVSWVIY